LNIALILSYLPLLITHVAVAVAYDVDNKEEEYNYSLLYNACLSGNINKANQLLKRD
jgi:hypothetical protein